MKDPEKEFIEILEQNQRIIYKVCYLYAGDPETLKDLYQEVVLHLWKGFPRFRGESSSSTWIYRIALNTCVSYYRKEKRRADTVEIPSHLNLYDETPDNESIFTLYRIINQLNPLDKGIILLYLEEKSYEEIAGIIGISKTNVGVRLSRIKEKLTKLSNN